MRISSKREFIWSDRQNRYILLKDLSIIWTGPVVLCKGASQEQTSLGNSQQAFYDQMTKDYSQQFANQNAILGTLTTTLNPIIAAGPNQYGFNKEQENVLNSQAIQGTGQEYAKAAKALNENIASAGGGDEYLPSGVAKQQQANVAVAGANQASDQLLNVKKAGYDQGYQTYESAISQLGGVAGMYNPNGVAGGANSAGSDAGSTLNQIQQANQAANPFNAILGAVGGAASAYLGRP